MAKNVVIRQVIYNGVPGVEIPLAADPNTSAFFVDTSDATLNSGGQMLNNVTSYANGTKYTGSIETKSSSDISSSGATITVPAGYYATNAHVTMASGSATPQATISGTSASVSTGNNTLTLSKSISNTPVVTAGYIASGTAGNSSISLTASITTKAAATITPGTSNQTIASGTYLTGTQTIAGDASLVSGNIVEGATIFNVQGNVKVPVVSQDSTTKILSIS